MQKLKEYIEVNLRSQNPVLGLIGLRMTGKEAELELLREAKHLRTFYLIGNHLEDYDFLCQMEQLESLNLSRNQLKDISFLANLGNLHTLNLSHNCLCDISLLQYLSKLRTLILSENQLCQITALQNLQELESLDLNTNQLENLNDLQALTQLHSLDFRHNPVKDVTFLKQLPRINQLNLSPQYLRYPPLAYVCWYSKGGKLGDYTYLPELPEVEKIWQIICSGDAQNLELARQLAQSQGWTSTEFELHANLFYEHAF